MKKILIASLTLLLLLTKSSCVFAEGSPLSVPNNKFGIHITSENDLNDAVSLVNSGGGDWGYVTIVITEAERDQGRFQSVFDQMRRDHLIPIVRLATKADGNIWEAPKEEEINNWVAFLNSLNWVVQNRYVVIGNEPNHASEWGGSLDPAAYAVYLKEFSGKLKAASSDFFILPAGLDASAKNIAGTMEEGKYLKLMDSAVPDIFDSIDGWTSHCYPNPDFSGAPTATGKGTVATYDWELSYLKTLGLEKNLPVFITETGWSNENLSEDEIGRRLTYAYENVWDDARVVAVTPFILNYTQAPFNIFSWKKPDGSFYSFYATIQKISKIKGEPQQVISGNVLAAFAQPIVLIGSDFVGAILARNTGQSIWNPKSMLVKSETDPDLIKNYSFNEVEPGRLGLIFFKARAQPNAGLYKNSVYLATDKNQRVTDSFPIEAFVLKFDQMQTWSIFGKITGSLRNAFFLPKF
jgi:hypothetical protein